MKQSNILLINNYLEDLQSSPRPLAIFDLDSTLYNVSPRTSKIVQDFCRLDEMATRFPKETSTLLSITINKSDWGYFEALERNDFVTSVIFLKLLAKFWRKNFFSNDYMDHDLMYNGASNFVNATLARGCEIIYLTGRSHSKMREGSIRNLKRDNFPLKNDQSLVMKTNTDLQDHLYKSDFIKSIMSEYDQIILFENEPKILNRVRKDHPEVKLCFINSTHSRAEELRLKIPTIEMDFTKII